MNLRLGILHFFIINGACYKKYGGVRSPRPTVSPNIVLNASNHLIEFIM